MKKVLGRKPERVLHGYSPYGIKDFTSEKKPFKHKKREQSTAKHSA